MNTKCRTDSADYNRTLDFNYVDATDTEIKIAIEKEVESIEEFFVWEDDKAAVYDKAVEIVEFSDDLKESLMLIVSQGIGTDKVTPHTIKQFIAELQKTVKAYVIDNLEKG